MSRPPNTGSNSTLSQQSGLGFLARFGWFLIGPATAIISLIVILENRQANFSLADVVLWCTVAACIGLRYVDISRLNGLKATGEPASIADWRRYTLILLIVVLMLWGIARRVAILEVLKR
jgi:hypothetical protein